MPRKLDQDRTHGEKLVRLLSELLFSGRRHSLTELSRSLGCSKQTVMRLVDEVTLGLDVPVEEEIVGGRKYYRMPRPKLDHPALPLSPEEMESLLLCRAFAQHLLGPRQFQAAMRGAQKSAQLLAGDGPLPDAHFTTLRPGTIDYTPHQEHLATLLAGLSRRRVCEVRYRRVLDSEDLVFRIKPLKIFSFRDTVYVHARYAKMPGQPYRAAGYDPVLALQRFRDVVLTDTPYRPPARYDFERVFNRHFGVIKGRRFRVTAEFRGWAAGFVAERTWSPDQKVDSLGDGRIRLRFTATSEPEVLAWILGFDEEARLVGPKALVGKLTERLDRVREVYGGTG